jgi:hypothetical protein
MDKMSALKLDTYGPFESIIMSLLKGLDIMSLSKLHVMEQRTLKNVNNCLNTTIHSYLETSGGQSYNLYLNVVHFFNTSGN